MTTTAIAKSSPSFLAAGIRWVKALLEARIAAVSPQPEADRSWFSRRPPPQPHDAAAAQQAQAEMDRAAAAAPETPFLVASARFGLAEFERHMLLLALAPEIDTSIPPLMARAQGDPSAKFATFALGMAIFPAPSWDALSPEHPLRGRRLIEVHQHSAVSLINAPLRIDERIAAYVKGLDYLDERLASLVTAMGTVPTLAPSQENFAEALARWLTSDTSRGLVQLSGSHAAAKADIVARAATLADRRAYAVHAEALPASPEDLATFERLWSREAELQRLVLFVQGVETVEPLREEGARPTVRPRWPLAFAGIGGPCLLDVLQPSPELNAVPVVAVAPPGALERRALWRSELTIAEQAPPEADIVRLAGEFTTSTSQIRTLASRARAFAAAQGGDVQTQSAAAVGEAWIACIQHAGAALAGITRWVTPRATLADVKLPPAEREQLERFVNHARQRSIVLTDFGFAARGERGLGFTALFHGESGTGKTMAAEAVAHALGLGLAITDIATIKSKYIGETEKNLRRIFTAAEHGGAVLFFDEADAFFSKRSDVKDSHDRYANVEIDYLLTRMEHFSGVAILATNQKHAVDPAFMRRLRLVIGFPFPGAGERQAIWQAVFPAETPLTSLDYDRLARFSLTGGSIFNAALGAAHAAAADRSPVEMRHVLDAIRWELRKLERPAAAAEFHDTVPAVPRSGVPA